jgi:hypothetical protein
VSEVIALGDKSYPFRSVLTPYGKSECGKPVVVPERYWFFLDRDGVFYSCSFTSVSTSRRVSSLTARIVDKLIALKRGESGDGERNLPRAQEQMCGGASNNMPEPE